jgi:thiamine biosynthesis protein ThiI
VVRILQPEREPVVLVASAEFTLKSSPVRRTLEQRLIDDLRVALGRAGFEGFRVEKHAARLVVRGLSESTLESAAKCCARVFGVAYAVPAVLLPSSMDIVLEEIVHTAQTSLRTGQSFAVRCHRITPSSTHRRDIEIKGGSEVLRALKDRGVRVDLKKPDVTIAVDLAEDWVLVYGSRMQGPGGLPLSSQWKMLAVLDSGPLTILAAYTMMRRGCMVELLIPLSETIRYFNKDRQLQWATKLRSLVTRPAYRAFTIDMEPYSAEYANAKSRIRNAALQVAKEKRFRGVIFSDIMGDLNLLSSKEGTTESNMRSPIFYPLLAFGIEDLFEMCPSVGISKGDLLSQMRLEKEFSGCGKSVGFRENLGDLTVQEIWL